MSAGCLLPSGNGNLLRLSRPPPWDLVSARRWRRSNSTALLLHRRSQDTPATSRQWIGVSQPRRSVSQPQPSILPAPAACLRQSVGHLAPWRRLKKRPGPAQVLFSYHFNLRFHDRPPPIRSREKHAAKTLSMVLAGPDDD